jgi:hypothetical protein
VDGCEKSVAAQMCPAHAGSVSSALALLLAVLLVAACGASTPFQTSVSLGTGAPASEAAAPIAPASEAAAPIAPDINGTTLDGLVSLSEYRGKPLVLAFMAGW